MKATQRLGLGLGLDGDKDDVDDLILLGWLAIEINRYGGLDDQILFIHTS